MELGSEFNLRMYEHTAEDNLKKVLKDYNVIYTDGGRSALRALIAKNNIKSVLLPDFICESVIDCFDEGQIAFYRINTDMSIDVGLLEKLISEKQVDCLYLMHYFGSIQDELSLKKIVKLKKKYGFTIIEDTTHSIFTKLHTIGDFCVCSLRKWLPLPDGGVVYSKDELGDLKLYGMNFERIEKKLYAMQLKTLYIRGLGDYNTEYRRLFAECEEDLDRDVKNRRISSVSEGILSGISISEEQNKRRENLRYVRKHLKNKLIKFVFESEAFTPLVAPIYVKNRDKLRTYLIEHNIFCAVHWPIISNLEQRQQAKIISEMILSLPLDSRYDASNLSYMCEILNDYREE